MNNINKKRNINGTASYVTPSAVSMSYLDDLSSPAMPTSVTPAVVDGGGHVASLPKAASAVPAVSDVSTGGYVDRLSNPVVPTAADGSGGSSVVPAAVDGSGSGSSGDSGNGGVSYTGYTGNEMTSKDYLSEYEQHIYHDFNLNQQYAENARREALENAEAARKSAKLEAEANFRQNAANYGIRGEQMLSQGLAGGGYSDFLEGKNMETRADSYSIANADYNAAVEAANDTYTNNLLNARAKLSADELALLKEKKAIYDAIAEEKKLIFEQLFAKVENGDYTMEEANLIFDYYGTLTDQQKSALEVAYGHYLRDVAAMAADAVFSMKVNTGGEIKRSDVKNWLIDTLRMTDSAAEATLNDMFDDAGNYIYAKDRGNNQTGGTGTGGGQTGGTGTGGGQTGGTGTGGGQTDGTGDTETTETEEATAYSVEDLITKIRSEYPDAKDEAIKRLIETADKDEQGNIYYVSEGFKSVMDKNDYNTLNTFKERIDDWEIGPGTNSFKLAYDTLSAQVEEGYISKGKMNEIDKVFGMNGNNGFIKTGAQLHGVNDYDTTYGEGDDFEVEIGDAVYKVESEGKADDAVIDAARENGVGSGTIFGYGSELYIKVGDNAYKLGARDFFYNGDYEELWKAVYKDQIEAIKTGISVKVAEGSATTSEGNVSISAQKGDPTDVMLQNTYRGYAWVDDEDDLNINGKQYSSINFVDVDNDDKGRGASLAAKKVSNGEAFVYYDDIYVKRGDKVMLADITGSEKKEIIDAIKKNSEYSVKYENIATPINVSAGEDLPTSIKNNTNLYVIRKASGDDYKYTVSVDAILGEDSDPVQAAITAGVKNGYLFSYHKDMYIYSNGKAYKLGATTGVFKDDYGKLVQAETGNRFSDKNPDPFNNYTDENKRGVQERMAADLRGTDAKFKDHAFGFTKDFSPNDNFNVEIGGTTYGVESAGEMVDSKLKEAVKTAGIKNDDVFRFNDNFYLFKDDKIYLIRPRPLDGSGYNALQKDVTVSPKTKQTQAPSETTEGPKEESPEINEPETNETEWVGDIYDLTLPSSGEVIMGDPKMIVNINLQTIRWIDGTKYKFESGENIPVKGRDLLMQAYNDSKSEGTNLFIIDDQLYLRNEKYTVKKLRCSREFINKLKEAMGGKEASYVDFAPKNEVALKKGDNSEKGLNYSDFV